MFDPFKPFLWQLAHGKAVELGPKGVLMGILNVTPDSFSDGGKYSQIDAAVSQASKMKQQGALLIDVGGESTRPGASEVTAKEEQKRVLPVIEALADVGEFLISVDTWRADTARKAVAAGAHIINDVWGFQKDPDISKVAYQSEAGCVLMHSGRERLKDADPIKDQIAFLAASIEVAKKAGLSDHQIVLDPGFGFAKNTAENLEILAKLESLFELGFPILTGTSRKRFIGDVTGRDASRRDVGTAATTVVARMKGSSVFRVHDVAKNADALKMADAVLDVPIS